MSKSKSSVKKTKPVKTKSIKPVAKVGKVAAKLKGAVKKPDEKDADVEVPVLEEYESDINYTAADEEFFDEKNFKDFNTKIKFRMFDPEKYENEIHRDINIVPHNSRKTSEIMTKFEFTEVVSHRAKQIENGGKIYTNIEDEGNPIKMAEMEIRMRQCPLAIRRMLSHNLAEIWDVNEMTCIY